MLTPVLFSLLLQAPGIAEASEWKRLGVAAASEKKLDVAVSAFEKACGLNPADEENCYFLARTLFLLDRYQEAQAAFDKALQSASEAMRFRVHRAAALNYIALN